VTLSLSAPSSAIETDNLSRANSVPKAPPASLNSWERIGVSYHGCPVYVYLMDGTMAYEADGERLVSIPEEVEDAIVDILFLDWQLTNLPEETLAALKQRAN
jgi:hypothetical protein